MLTKEQKKAIKSAEIKFSEIKIEKDDTLIIRNFDQGFGERSYFYIYNKYGHIKDIQIGKKVEFGKNPKIPKLNEKSFLPRKSGRKISN